MKVLFTGDRKWRPEYEKALIEVFDELQDWKGEVKIIVGDCPTGVDASVAVLANTYKIPCHVEGADWGRYGKGAGMIRNKAMVDLKPDICIACHHDLTQSKGTKDCTKQAIRAGITTVMIPRQCGFSLKDYEL